METTTDKFNRVIFKMDTNHVIVNALRRIIFQNIPVYAWDPSLITFEYNTTVYNNDYLRKRISNLPVYGLPLHDEVFHQFVVQHRKWVINNEKITEDDTDVTNGDESQDDERIYQNTEISTKVMESSSSTLNMSCKVTHNAMTTRQPIRNVTTDDCQYIIDGKEISSPYKTPLLICKLRDGESLSFSASSRMNIPLESPIWNCVANCYFIEDEEDKKYRFIIEPRVGLSETEIMKRAAFILTEKLKWIMETIKDVNAEDKTSGELKMYHDKFTLPNLLTFYLQDHEGIEYAGYKCEHLLNDVSIIYYRTKGKRVITKIVHSVCEEIISVLNKLVR